MIIFPQQDVSPPIVQSGKHTQQSTPVVLQGLTVNCDTDISSFTFSDVTAWQANSPGVLFNGALADADVADATLSIDWVFLVSFDGQNYSGAVNTWTGGRLDDETQQPAIFTAEYGTWDVNYGYPSWCILGLNPSRTVTIEGDITFG